MIDLRKFINSSQKLEQFETKYVTRDPQLLEDIADLSQQNEVIYTLRNQEENKKDYFELYKFIAEHNE